MIRYITWIIVQFHKQWFNKSALDHSSFYTDHVTSVLVRLRSHFLEVLLRHCFTTAFDYYDFTTLFPVYNEKEGVYSSLQRLCLLISESVSYEVCLFTKKEIYIQTTKSSSWSIVRLHWSCANSFENLFENLFADPLHAWWCPSGPESLPMVLAADVPPDPSRALLTNNHWQTAEEPQPINSHWSPTELKTKS